MDNDPTRSFLALSNGTEIAQYQIVSRIGAGGMGEVYLAQDRSLNRKVALKFLSSSLCNDPECRIRFTNEAQAAAKLNHPNIVTIHEVSEYQSRPFFAMEVVEGQSLKDYITHDKPDIDGIIDLAIQICDGLKAAHEMGVVHRDIKPSNILIDNRGRARIVDFGLATVKGIEGLTKAGSTAGTPAYMSPEQVRGEKVGATSDLFSLGVVLYQMFTGRLPFSGDYEAALVYSITNDDPQPVREHDPDIPNEIEAIIHRLLEKNSSRRFQSADEVLGALKSLRGGPVPSAVRGKKRVWLRVGGVVLILAGLALVTQLVFKPVKKAEAGKKTVAVLPFENLGAPEDDYFADGQTDAIIMQLGKYGELGVISRTSSMLYKDSDKSPQEIGEELGATYLLEGTILWEKNAAFSEVRINTALVRASDGSQVWADSYERVLDKVFILQSEIAENVTGALRVAIGSGERYQLNRAPTDDLQAYDYFLRGNEYFNRSWEQADIQAALELFRKAVTLDPEYAVAYAMLSRCHASMYWEYYDRTDERRVMAIEAAQKSLELQPDLIEGHLAMGYCHYQCGRDYQHALKEFERGLEIQPNNADLYNAVACIQRRRNDFESSARNFVTALKLDPRSHLKAWDAGLTFSMMRDYERADKYLVLAASLAPNFSLAYIYRAWQQVLRGGNVEKAHEILNEAAGKADLSSSKFYWWLARVIDKDYRKTIQSMHPGSDSAAYYLQRAQFHRLLGEPEPMLANADTARMILERKLNMKSDDAAFHSSLGVAYAYLGRSEEASAHAQQALSLLPVSRDAFDAPFLIVNFIEILVMAGEYEAAVEQLKFLMSMPGFVSPAYLKLDPLWIPLHGRPDFDSLLTASV